jgi:hypothetical protein
MPPAPDVTAEREEALARVRAGGLAHASEEDLHAAAVAGGDVLERELVRLELRRRAEDRVRQAAHAAREADRTLTEDRRAQVRDAIHAVGERLQRGDYLPMSELRAALPPDMSRAEVDATLRRLGRDGDIEFVPEPAQANLRQADHENAIWVGGGPNHLITWNRRRE